MPIPAIVLAAGASRRLGQPKQLLLLDGETLLERAIRLAAEAGADPVFVILGAHFERICAAVPFNQLPHAILVINSEWAQGIASSINTALRPLSIVAPRAEGALILSCDQPRLTAAHLRALLERFAAQPAPTIVASTYAGVLGIPAVFPREVFADLRALRGDKGARALLMKPPCPLISLPFPGGEIDIDEPADLAQLGE
ncbi:MAG: nucleotidyltransferase family protein [Terracidiphilus sp.]|nr:nucleotidyltransferase family protein [Terracidiphilus sp.]